MISRLLTLALACLLAPGLSGCAAAAIGGTTYAVKASARDALEPQAVAGDAEAQYRLGMSWCCMGPGFDTETATRWLCAAARQGHARSLYELGRIHAGEVSRTPAPGQKLLRLATARTSPAHALAFFELAGERGIEDAVSRSASLRDDLDSATIAAAAGLKDDFTGTCTYDAVYH